MANIAGTTHFIPPQFNAPEPGPRKGPDAAAAPGFFDILKGQIAREDAPRAQEPDRAREANPAQKDDEASPAATRQARKDDDRKNETAPRKDEAASAAPPVKPEKDMKEQPQVAVVTGRETAPVSPKTAERARTRTGDARDRDRKDPKIESDERELKDINERLRHLLDLIRKEQKPARDLEQARTGTEFADVLARKTSPLREELALLRARLARLEKPDGAKERAAAAEMKQDMPVRGRARDRARQESAKPEARAAFQAEVQAVAKRIEALAESIRPEQKNAPQAGDRGPQSLEFYSQMTKNEALSARQAAREAGPRNAAFMETLNEIVSGARVTVRDEKNATFTVKLYPPELGSVNVSIGLEKGVVSGRFLVESDDARQALMNNLEYVKRELADAGIALGEFRVDVNDRGSRFFDERERRPENHVIVTPINAEDMKDDYVAHAVRAHEGLIDVVI